MTKEEMIIKYKSYRDQMKATNYALYLISWDAETEAPSNSVEERSKQIGILSEMNYKLERNEEYISIVKTLYEEKDCCPLRHSYLGSNLHPPFFVWSERIFQPKHLRILC